MASTEHHMPDVDAQKISLLPWGSNQGQDTMPQDYSVMSNGTANGDGHSEKYMNNARGRRKRAQRNEGLIAAVCRWTVRHQVGESKAKSHIQVLTNLIGLSINILLIHALAHICFPRARQTTRKFYRISYYDPETGNYAAGWDDLYMVLYSIIVLTGLRAATLDYVLAPLAQWLGASKKKEKIRFAEQAWILIYSSVFWTLGMVRSSNAHSGGWMLSLG